MKRELYVLFILFLAFQATIGSSAASTIYVDDDGSGNYTTIQAALKDAVDGDTIIVNPGTYPNERIKLDKSVTIKGASEYPSVGGFDILRQAQVEGLTITQEVNFDQGGVSCTILNNRFDGCGISIGNSYVYGNQVIMNNLFTGSPIGISTFDSIDNNITGNTFQNCEEGISLTSGGGGHVVTGNTFENCGVGIHITYESASIYNNYFSNNVNLKMEGEGNVLLSIQKTAGTNIIGGPYIGGNFWGSPSGDGFSQTHLDTNGDGIAEEVYQINENVVDYLPLVIPRTEPAPALPEANFKASVTQGPAPLSVTFTDLSRNAVSWSWDFDNNGQPDSTVQSPVYVYENPGEYTVNLTVSNQNGTDSQTAMITVMEKQIAILPVADFSTNTTSGYPPLPVLFTDLSQNATSRSWDINNDGIEDSKEASFAYVYTAAGTYTANLTVSNANGTDSKLTTITVEQDSVDNVLPVANFSTNVTSGYAPLSVLFTDLSQNATSRSWDVNSDGVENSNASSFVYQYASAGTYTAKLTAINANGTDEKTAIITVSSVEDEHHSSSGGSSGGGGGGGSPEPARNVEVKELSQVFITNGKAIQFDFTKNATCVVYVGFDAKKTVGKTTTIVEQLKGKSSLVSKLPEGEVYKSFNVWVGNSGFATSKNIENPVICFKVEKSWILDKDINQDSISLNRYSDKKWKSVGVNLSGEDDKFLYFIADVPGFSSFAITGKARGTSGNISEDKNGLEMRALQGEEDETTGLNTGPDKERDEKIKLPHISPVYGTIGMLLLCLICAFIYTKLPK